MAFNGLSPTAVSLNIIIIMVLILLQCQANASIIPHQNDVWWNEMFQKESEDILKGDCNLLLAGDSITMRFENTAPDTWNRFIIPHRPVNFGIDGDQTTDLMYRLRNAPLEKISPDFCTLLIGVNDLLNIHAPKVVASRIQEVTIDLAARYPSSTILLYYLFPAEKKPGPVRKRIDETNQLLSQQQYPQQVRLINITGKFLSRDGTLNDAILTDQIHLSRKGYEIWGESICGEVETG